jgi:hypothetical protein
LNLQGINIMSRNAPNCSGNVGGNHCSTTEELAKAMVEQDLRGNSQPVTVTITEGAAQGTSFKVR